ncbi:MAG TPA: transposase [Candidatus Omnitrophota bacterium]|nr:transposase [Candidatus Omnitrophota bacterium]
MGRSPRQESGTGLYHVIVRGNNKGRLFHGYEDFDEFLEIIGEYLKKYPVQIQHYCLMTNHAHLLLRSENSLELSRYMHGIQRAYHHYYRKNYTHFGHLFQGRYRSLPIEKENYLLDCGRYIERNPVRAKMVSNPAEWPYSSYGFYAYGIKNELLTVSVAYQALGGQPEIRQERYRRHVEATRPYEELIDKELVGV